MEIISVAENKITSIRKELGKEVSEAEVHQAQIRGFEKSLNIQLANGELTPYEHNLVERLRREKYATENWNFKGIAQTA
jgi:lipoate-protein ligase A